MIKIVIILVILIGLGLLGAKLSQDDSSDDILVAIDNATQQAISRGEFEVPEGVSYVEKKDCEGTQWIKQQECSLNGKPMDGTEGSCGPGKEIWILDQTHSSFKPATGGGKCEPEERDCSVECPKPCEGDTWTDTGRCVRKEYDTRGNMKEVVLDGTEGKCGEGITQFNLDTTAPDYKPAVGKGECPMTKGGACNVPCPKPEPPKCNNYTGWVENVGLGCVMNEFSTRKVQCGQKGVKQYFNVSTNPKHCEELIKWETCTGKPCPIDCVGSWSGWSAPKSDEPCGVQPYKEKTYSVTTQAQHGGQVCGYTHGDTRKQNAGSPLACCEVTGDWAKVGDCKPDGTAKWIRPYKENKPGGCDNSQKAKIMACCYPKGDWRDITGCNENGKKTQEQTTVNCIKEKKTREIDCEYVGEWYKNGGCGTDGKQWWSRTTVNSNKTRSESRDCCYEGPWKKGLVDGQHESALIGEDANGNAVNGNSWYGSWSPNHWKAYSIEEREIKNCPPGHPTEKRSYKCGRGSCRQYDKYWFWASNANLKKGREGPCGSTYNCCERWEPCSEDSNEYIKGPKGTQGEYQYSY